MIQSVSPQYLLEGAAYALQQCGLLLRDANVLYRNKSYASAVVLASFAAEELGKWTLLLELRRKVLRGDEVTLDDVKKRCIDHETKQSAGIAHITVRDFKDGGDLIAALVNATPGSEERKALQEKLNSKLDEMKKRLPRERYSYRLEALYVDPDPLSPTGWKRPVAKITPASARNSLMTVSNDYMLRSWLGYRDLEMVKSRDAELADALEKWPQRPVVLAPESPVEADNRSELLRVMEKK
jgi:AbiV family abortive infection protein